MKRRAFIKNILLLPAAAFLPAALCENSHKPDQPKVSRLEQLQAISQGAAAGWRHEAERILSAERISREEIASIFQIPVEMLG